jgi:hypothetical protein
MPCLCNNSAAAANTRSLGGMTGGITVSENEEMREGRERKIKAEEIVQMKIIK